MAFCVENQLLVFRAVARLHSVEQLKMHTDYLCLGIILNLHTLSLLKEGKEGQQGGNESDTGGQRQAPGQRSAVWPRARSSWVRGSRCGEILIQPANQRLSQSANQTSSLTAAQVAAHKPRTQEAILPYSPHDNNSKVRRVVSVSCMTQP